MNARLLLWVFLGGGVGTLARYGLQIWLGEPSNAFDVAIFSANIAGAFGLGFVTTALQHVSAKWQTFLGPGFFGGFTTYSALMVFPLVAAREGLVAEAIGYFILSLVCGFLAAWAGYRLGKSGQPRPSAGGHHA